MDQNRPLQAKMGQMDHFGPFWSRECQNPVRNKLILTKMVVWTIWDRFGPAHLPTVPRPLLIENREKGSERRSETCPNNVNHSDRKRGRPKGATSKIVKKCQKYFRHFSTFFMQGKKPSTIVEKCQKVVRHFSTIFARHHFTGPFWGALS